HDRQPPHPRRPGVEHERVVLGGLPDPLEQLAGGQPVAGEARQDADRLALVVREAAKLVRAQRAGDLGVVADLEVRIQRQVIRDEGDLGVEQEFQAYLQRGVHGPKAVSPEQPMVDHQQLHALGGRQLEQLRVRGYTARHGADLARSRYLQAVGAVVLEAPAPEQAIDVLEDFRDGGGHRKRWNPSGRVKYSHCVGAWRSLVARTVRVGEVPGSNPGAPIGEVPGGRGVLVRVQPGARPAGSWSWGVLVTGGRGPAGGGRRWGRL